MKKRILSFVVACIMMFGVLPVQVVMAETLPVIEELEVDRKIHDEFEITPELLEWGKYPGLNVDILHKYGFTGKGVTIAYVDQPFDEHEEYQDVNVHYTNNSEGRDSMHGPAVLSLLAGKDIGVAPDVEVYYYAHACWEADQRTHAECLYQIIEQNKLLPDDEKITMIGFSDIIDDREKNADILREAVAECEKNGIMVWFCNEYMMSFFVPFSDKNNYDNLVINYEQEDLIYVPTSRTTADKEGFSYWTTGGTSWAMPYALGLYGMAKEINPTLDEDGLRKLMHETAYIRDGLKIINPVGFISEVLKTVGRNAEADAMLQEVAARNQYVYAVMDTSKMSNEVLVAVADYLAQLPYTVLTLDTSNVKSIDSVFDAIKTDAGSREGSIIGIRFFDNSFKAPAIEGNYSKYCESYCNIHKVDTIHVTSTRGKITSNKSLMPKFEGALPNGYLVYCAIYQKLDNGYYRFTVEYKALENMIISLVYTTDSTVEQEVIVGKTPNEIRNVLRMDIPAEEWEAIKTIGIKFQMDDITYIARYNK